MTVRITYDLNRLYIVLFHRYSVMFSRIKYNAMMKGINVKILGECGIMMERS